jgi:replicative DNA helicase Mcm
MARADDTELIDTFEEFYRNYYRNEIAQLAQRYPTEQKSLYLDWQDLQQFDTDLADDFRNKPKQLREYAEEALRLYDLPVDVSLGRAHVRVHGLPETTDIREIRADHRGMLISVQGIVRKATDVRPKITTAAFECQRCGTLTRIPQDGGDFQEPHECGGCERQGPFQINYDQSEFIDAQKLRVQESPEGLRGGETPQSVDVNIEDDITGAVTAGDHVSVTGVLQLEQQGSDREKSAMFDIYIDGMTVEIEDEEFEEMDITEEDKKEIIELASKSDIYERMEGAIAPSIYGYEKEKRAIAFQLFSGVTKHLPDGSRTRGDLHMLLIGDPGTGKCQKYNTKVALADGRDRELGALVESNLDDPVEIDDGYYQETDIEVLTTDGTGIERGTATKVWKREAPEQLYRIETASGREVEVTPSHPLFVQREGRLAPVVASELSEGEFVAAPRTLPSAGDDTLEVTFEEARHGTPNSVDCPDELTDELARVLGHIIGEGNVSGPPSSREVRVTNADSEIIEDVSNSLDSLGLRYRVKECHNREGTAVVRCSSVEFTRLLRELEPAILESSDAQRVPDIVFRASRRRKREFLRAYIEGEAHVSQKERELSVASMSEELLAGVQSLLLSFGIDSQLRPRQNGSYRLRISGKDFAQYANEIGFITERKAEAAAAVADTAGNTNTDVVPDVGDTLRRVREALALSQSDCGIARSTYQHYERGDRNPSRECLEAVVSAFEERLAWLADARERVTEANWETVVGLRDELNLSQAALAAGTDVTQTAVSYYERRDAVPDGGTVADTRGVVLDRIDEGLAVEDTVKRLRSLAEGAIGWDRITSIERVRPTRRGCTTSKSQRHTTTSRRDSSRTTPLSCSTSTTSRPGLSIRRGRGHRQQALPRQLFATTLARASSGLSKRARSCWQTGVLQQSTN